MTDPKQIQTLRHGAQYKVPFYKVTDNGLEDAERSPIPFHFVKGNKEDGKAFRQEGFVTETILKVCQTYLEDNNVGHLKSEETAGAIMHIEAALKCLQDRADKRKASGVQGTYRATGPIVGEEIGPENS